MILCFLQIFSKIPEFTFLPQNKGILWSKKNLSIYFLPEYSIQHIFPQTNFFQYLACQLFFHYFELYWFLFPFTHDATIEPKVFVMLSAQEEILLAKIYDVS